MTAPADHQTHGASAAGRAATAGEASDGDSFYEDYDEGRVYHVSGQDWDEVVAPPPAATTGPATSTWSSTWARSIRRRTACSGWW